MNLKWRHILVAILLVLLLAYNRHIAARLRELRLGEMWEEFCAEIWGWPPLGRFTVVAMTLALLYVTAYYLLIQNRRK